MDGLGINVGWHEARWGTDHHRRALQRLYFRFCLAWPALTTLFNRRLKNEDAARNCNGADRPRCRAGMLPILACQEGLSAAKFLERPSSAKRERPHRQAFVHL